MAAKKKTAETTSETAAPVGTENLKVRVHDTLTPATLMQFMSQPDSQFFGYYKVSFSKADYKAAAGTKGLCGCGYKMEEDSTKKLIIALIKPDFVVVGEDQPQGPL